MSVKKRNWIDSQVIIFAFKQFSNDIRLKESNHWLYLFALSLITQTFLGIFGFFLLINILLSYSPLFHLSVEILLAWFCFLSLKIWHLEVCIADSSIRFKFCLFFAFFDLLWSQSDRASYPNIFLYAPYFHRALLGLIPSPVAPYTTVWS